MTKIKITKEEIGRFVRKNTKYKNNETYGYIDGGCSIHEWLEDIVYKKCPENAKLLHEVTVGKVDDMLRGFKDIFGHLNYKYDTLSYILIKKISKIKKRDYGYLEAIESYFPDIQININHIPSCEHRSYYMKKFNELFIKIYKYLKSQCKIITRADIMYVNKLTRKQFLKRIKYHPYITSDRRNIRYYD